jgi:hypothetical protein
LVLSAFSLQVPGWFFGYIVPVQIHLLSMIEHYPESNVHIRAEGMAHLSLKKEQELLHPQETEGMILIYDRAPMTILQKGKRGIN